MYVGLSFYRVACMIMDYLLLEALIRVTYPYMDEKWLGIAVRLLAKWKLCILR